jgi:hypothetical protein
VEPHYVSDRCAELQKKILQTVVPDAQPGGPSAISEREIQNGIGVSAIALRWHLSALDDPIRRDELAGQLIWDTLSLVSSTEAAALANQKGITMEEAFAELCAHLCLPAKSRDDSVREPRPAKSQYRMRSEPPAIALRPRTLPPLVMPVYFSLTLGQAASRLLRLIDSENTPNRISTISDEEIEERAFACLLALCWLIAALKVTPKERTKIAITLLEDLQHRLIRSTPATGFTGAGKITVQ